MQKACAQQQGPDQVKQAAHPEHKRQHTDDNQHHRIQQYLQARKRDTVRYR